jgi:hypothetical protein
MTTGEDGVGQSVRNRAADLTLSGAVAEAEVTVRALTKAELHESANPRLPILLTKNREGAITSIVGWIAMGLIAAGKEIHRQTVAMRSNLLRAGRSVRNEV